MYMPVFFVWRCLFFPEKGMISLNSGPKVKIKLLHPGTPLRIKNRADHMAKELSKLLNQNAGFRSRAPMPTSFVFAN